MTNATTKTTTCRLSTEFVDRAKSKNLTAQEFADMLLIHSQGLHVVEQELALSRLDEMETKVYSILKSQQDLEEKLDVLTKLLNKLFLRLGE